MRVNRRIWLGSVASFVAMTLANPPVVAQQPKKPNIVFILMDNLGYGELGSLRRWHPSRRAHAAH